MDKATHDPSTASVESVMALAFELARIREQHGAQSGMYLSEVRALRAELERLAAQAAPTEPGGDVEPVAFMFQHSETGRVTFVDAWQKENGWAAANPRYSEVGALHGASTVAALKAENEALRKDAERYRWLRDGELTADYPYPVMRMGGSRVDDQTIWNDELDAAIDAALTKGQP